MTTYLSGILTSQDNYQVTVLISICFVREERRILDHTPWKYTIFEEKVEIGCLYFFVCLFVLPWRVGEQIANKGAGGKSHRLIFELSFELANCNLVCV